MHKKIPKNWEKGEKIHKKLSQPFHSVVCLNNDMP
jgi:hypothetical protein